MTKATLLLAMGLTLAGALAVAGCGPSGTLEVDSKLTEITAQGVKPTAEGLKFTGGDLVLTSVRVAVSEIELEGGTEQDEREAEMGAATIDVALDGKPTSVTVDTVDAGAYHTLGIELERSLNDASIEVKGTYKGRAFTFRSGLDKEVEFRLKPEVTVPENGSATVAVSFDVGHWFKLHSGHVIDPTDPTQKGLIEAQILTSLAASAEIEDNDGD